MKSRLTKLFPLILAFLIILQVFPISAFANEFSEEITSKETSAKTSIDLPSDVPEPEIPDEKEEAVPNNASNDGIVSEEADMETEIATDQAYQETIIPDEESMPADLPPQEPDHTNCSESKQECPEALSDDTNCDTEETPVVSEEQEITEENEQDTLPSEDSLSEELPDAVTVDDVPDEIDYEAIESEYDMAFDDIYEAQPELTISEEVELLYSGSWIKYGIYKNDHAYVRLKCATEVYSDSDLADEDMIYRIVDRNVLLLAFEHCQRWNTVSVHVWFMTTDMEIIDGYILEEALMNEIYSDEQAFALTQTVNHSDMRIGNLTLPVFVMNGSYPETNDEPMTPDDPIMEIEVDPVFMDDPEQDELECDETPDVDTLFVESKEDSEEGNSEDEVIKPSEVSEDQLPVETDLSDEEQSSEELVAEAFARANAGDCVQVTTKTREFGSIDLTADETYYSSDYQGNFVKDATVQVLSVSFDEHGSVWYQVRFLYGDDFADGRMKWTNYSTAWIKEAETDAAFDDSCTVTDFAYTLEYLKMTRSSGTRLLTTTPMTGFTLKKVNGKVGNFDAWQSSLYGSSGHDSDYPQIAKSAAHGVIYATPHYLEGFTVFCLEHKLSGPGEGSGSSQTAKGPYVLVDMDTFVNDSNYGGATGVRFKASTMHALGWVLKHTYPFMALNRSDSNNEVWSRVAGQFAMREVIKRMEGAQYVRDYWDMDNFYSFSGGAPAVYLTYARWLAENGIAHGRITGDIIPSNQRLSVSGDSYIGAVTLTTDADLIRIPRSVGALTGNSGGSDSDYYYVKSDDTINITSNKSTFTITMESIASDDEEANFLVGVPSVSIQKVLVPLYGHPYEFKSSTLTFELSLGEIQITKKSTDDTLLKGAVFELLNSDETVIATATTDTKGIATFFGLQPDSYTVREQTPPQGFKLSAASTQSITVTAGNTATATFINAPIQGNIRIVKTDGITGKPLSGVEFTVIRLTGPDSYAVSDIGDVVATITTNSDGVAETDLMPWGEYKITETGVMNGYLDTGYTTSVTIK